MSSIFGERAGVMLLEIRLYFRRQISFAEGQPAALGLIEVWISDIRKTAGFTVMEIFSPVCRIT